MDPSFKQIADLFQIAALKPPAPIDAPARPRKGRTADESEELGRQSLTDGDYEAAIKHFREAISQRDTMNPQTLVDLASAYEYSDQAPQALRQYEKALRIRQDPEPLLGISDLYKRHGRYRDSIEQLQKALSLEPYNSFLHLKLAETLLEMGERTRALSAAQAAIATKPDEAFYHYWVGDLLILMKRYDEALDAMRAAIELSPGDDFLYLRAAVAFWGAGKRQEAVKAVRLASDLDPDKHVYHGLLGIMLEELGQMDDAHLESDRASKMDRYDQDLLSRLLDEMRIEL